MKTIKSLSILSVMAIAGLISCSKDTGASDPLKPTALQGTAALADTKVKTTDLPQVVLDYIATNYPNSTISKSEIEDNGNYEIKLNDGTELIFGADGAFLGIDDDTNDDFGDTVVDPATLPQSITDYVATNYANLTITSASMENNGNYEVQLSDGSELVFDGNGGFLGIGVDDNEGGDSDDGDNQNGNQHEDGTVIDAATLPQMVKDYLTTTYPDATIVEARVMADGGYEVELSTGIEVVFDANGDFVKTEDVGSEDGD